MGLLTFPFKLPLMPARAVIRLGEVIQDETERQLHDPVLVRRQLEEAERARAAGDITDEELSRIEREAVGRLSTSTTGGTRETAGPGDPGGSGTARPGRTIGRS